MKPSDYALDFDSIMFQKALDEQIKHMPSGIYGKWWLEKNCTANTTIILETRLIDAMKNVFILRQEFGKAAVIRYYQYTCLN